MGFWSSVGSAFGSVSSMSEKEKSPEQLRKEHGFDGFDGYMDKLQNYDIKTEAHKTPSQTPQKKGKR